MQPKQQIVGLPVYKPGKPIEEVKRELNLTEVIKLASNENPFGPSPKVKQAIVEECDQLAIYPDGIAFDLRQTLAEHYRIQPEQLIFGNGSDEIVQMLARTFLTSDSHTVMATPTFPRYNTVSTIEGAEITEVPLNDGVHDLTAMLEAVNDRTRIVWICNPNNPSGTYVNEQKLQAFMEKVSSDVLVVFDEAYAEYVTADDYPNSVEWTEKYANLVVLRTFSKVYGLAALRIGYGIAHSEVIAHLNRVREPFNANSLAQKAALTAINDQPYTQQCFEKNKVGKQFLYESFNKLGLSYFESETNFVLVNVGRPAQPVFEALLRQGIIVRSGEALGFPTSIRITIGSQEQNEMVIKALASVLEGTT